MLAIDEILVADPAERLVWATLKSVDELRTLEHALKCVGTAATQPLPKFAHAQPGARCIRQPNLEREPVHKGAQLVGLQRRTCVLLLLLLRIDASVACRD